MMSDESTNSLEHTHPETQTPMWQVWSFVLGSMVIVGAACFWWHLSTLNALQADFAREEALVRKDIATLEQYIAEHPGTTTPSKATTTYEKK